MAFSEQHEKVTGGASASQITIPLEDFMANGSLSSDLIHCFGLLRYLNKFIVDRIQAAKARSKVFYWRLF